MSGYRLHIDIPFSGGEAEAMATTKVIIEMLNDNQKMNELNVEQINYRLGHDEDRQKGNYLEKNANGHIGNKKSSILFSKDLTSTEEVV